MSHINSIWDFIVRWRTRLFNGIGAAGAGRPAPGGSRSASRHTGEVSAVCDRGVFIINVLMRPRVAATKDDAEVQVRETLKAADGPAVITVKTPGNSKTIVNV